MRRVIVSLVGALPCLAFAFVAGFSTPPPVSVEAPAAGGSAAVSATVTVPAEAVWTFDAPAIAVTPDATEIHVWTRGHQAEIDLCTGPVASDYGPRGVVIGEHNHCGGAYVLGLEVGDRIRITGEEAGEYVVGSLLDVPKKGTPVSVLHGSDLFLQTCHFDRDQMRLAALLPEGEPS